MSMTGNPASLKKRLASGLVLAPVVLGLIYLGNWPFLAMVSFLTLVSGYEWVRLCQNLRYRILFSLAGLAYIIIGFYSGYILREYHGFVMAMLFISLIWVSDIGAYASGKIIGGPKLLKEISPNKTWAGLMGALLAPAGLVVLWQIIFKAAHIDIFILIYGFLSGLIIGLLGQGGDLLMSWAKRLAGVKDFSSFIPGHGGFLDRADSILLTAPVFLYFITKFPFLYG